MSQKKKLQNALKVLKSTLKVQALEDSFSLIEKAINDLQEEEKLTPNSELPAPNIEMDQIAIYSDGACRGNPGPGSWAFVAQNKSGEVLQKASGVSELTTNNRMELQGAIEGLAYLDTISEIYNKVIFYTDSRYVVDGISSWVKGWKARGWKKADKKTPENVEQWKLLDELAQKRDVKFVWVKGHSGHPQNELCDQLANEALDAQGY